MLPFKVSYWIRALNLEAWRSNKRFVILIIIAVLAVFTCLVWDWLGSGQESNSDTLRNIALVLATLIGLPLAIWRSLIAERNAENVLQQVGISERSLRNDQFQRSAEMLGNNEMTIRLGGIYALENLAQDYPQDHLDQVIKILAAFVRHPAHEEAIVGQEESSGINRPPFREDVEEAIRVISIINRNQTVEHGMPDLSRSYLGGIALFDMNFSKMRFDYAQMQKALLVSSDFTRASLMDVDLTGANLSLAQCRDAEFPAANFTDTDISSMDISNTNFAGVRGLGQEQLNQACHAPDCEPTLPEGLSMDHEAAVARWKELYGDE